MTVLLDKRILVAGVLLAATGVALGAFGAHALRSALGELRLGWWNTAVEYQMWHGVGLVAVAALPVRGKGPAALLLGSGALIFSGSLYLLALTGARWLGMVAPIGGALMISGWLLLMLVALRSGRE